VCVCVCVCVYVCVCVCVYVYVYVYVCVFAFVPVCTIGTGSLDPLSGMVAIAKLSLNNNQFTGTCHFSFYFLVFQFYTI
jgi:hypothetical protein